LVRRLFFFLFLSLFLTQAREKFSGRLAALLSTA